MKTLPELDHLNLDPATQIQVAAVIDALLAQAQQDSAEQLQVKDAELQRKELKIQALTYELAYYKRIRFSTKSEALSPLQRDVFEETWNTDLSAIEAEVEQLQESSVGEAVVKPKRPRAGRQPLPDHLPLYRLEQIAAREGVSLARSTLADWVGRVGVALKPLAERLKWHLLQGNTLLADETPVSQLEPGTGKTRKAYLWAYRSNDLQPGPRIIVFDYQTGRSGSHAREFLGDWRGHLMVDDYAGYKALFADAGGAGACIELGCLAHARRKFFDLHQANQSSIALEALNRIAELYAVEAEAKTLTIAERQALRAEKSVPALASLHAWLMATRAKTAPGGATAKALDYSLKRWKALCRYAETGHLPINNNPTENCIRPIAVGKKNWLFVGSERAGNRAAAIHTLLGTAKLNGLNPTEWLKDTLEKLPTWPNSRIDELLPFATVDSEIA